MLCSINLNTVCVVYYVQCIYQSVLCHSGRSVWQVGSLSHAINAEATGYLPLPDFPEEAPDPSVRDVEDNSAFWSYRPGLGNNKKTTEEGSDFYSSISGSEESGSESGSETGWLRCVSVHITCNVQCTY